MVGPGLMARPPGVAPPPSVAPHGLELARFDLTLDRVLHLVLARHLAADERRLAPELALPEAAELEDLEHIHEVDGRGQGEHAESTEHGGPEGVEVAAVVRVRNEPERQ